MLVIIDMQNEYVDEKGKSPVEGAKDLENGIINRIKEFEKKGESIFYTINTKIAHKAREKSEERWAIKPYGQLKEALEKHHMIEKINYAIAAEQAIQIKNKLMHKMDIEIIEFVGVETNICVLANGIVFQNLFPNAKIVINSKLCTSSNDLLHSKALDVMNALKMEVI